MARWIITIGLWCVAVILWAQDLNHDCYQNLKANKIPELHTDWLEFSPISYKKGLLFIAPEKVDRIDDQQLKSPYFRIQYWGPDDSAQLQNRFAIINHSDGHIGPLVMSADEEILYYTFSYSTGKTAKTEIWQATLENGQYQNAKKLAIFKAKKNNSYQHPSLGQNIMIFSANKAKDKDFDLWMMRKEKGKWMDPKPLSDSINSEFNEAFPFIYQDSILFFSSNRGGDDADYDIYYSFRTTAGWTKAQKLKHPINTSYDDLGFSISSSKDAFYWTSNRQGNQTGDDIYTMAVDKSRLTNTFDIPQDHSSKAPVDTTLTDTMRLTINVVELTSEGVYRPLDQVELISYALGQDYTIDLSKTKVNDAIEMPNKKGLWVSILPDDITTADMRSDTIEIKDGGILKETIPYDNYLLQFSKKGYRSVYRFLSSDKTVEKIEVVMQPNVQVQQPQTKDEQSDKSKIEALREKLFSDTELVVFDQLYYDYGSSSINMESVQELDRLAVFMQAYPNASVQLISHTDSRGNARFNLRLSEKRAQSAKQYLVKQGISSARIQAIGRGEQELRNHCSSGVYCSEEEHEYNRRTEVRIIME